MRRGRNGADFGFTQLDRNLATKRGVEGRGKGRTRWGKG